MKKNSHEYKKWLLVFVIFTIIMVTLACLSFLLPIDENYQVLISMILLLLLLVGMMMFRPRLMYYKESLMYYRLKEKQDPSITMKQSPISKEFSNKLINEGFTKSSSSDSFTMYTKYLKDRKQFHLKRSMLMVFILIKTEKTSYQDKEIIKQINLLEDSLYKEKKRIFNYTVFIAKEGPTLTPQIQESCDYVSFSKVGARSIVNINLFYEINSKSCYFLYSDSYSPSSYYRFAVQVLTKLIS